MSSMQTFLRTLSFFQVLLCVTMKSKAVRVFAGPEGGSVNIDCPYPDGYLYTPQYFCRDPCNSVLIRSTKADEVVSKGRYSAVNTVSARSFSVTIRNLKLTDSGVYYCGYDKWGIDKLTKVKVTVIKAPVMSRHDENPEAIELPCSTTATPTTAGSEHDQVFDHSTSCEQVSSTTHSSTPLHGQWFVVCGGLFGLLLSFVVAALVIFCRKWSKTHTASRKNNTPPLQIAQEDITLVGPAKEEDFSATYSTVQFLIPAEDDCSPFFFGELPWSYSTTTGKERWCKRKARLQHSSRSDIGFNLCGDCTSSP